MRNRPYRSNLKKYGVTTRKQLDNVYLCTICRKIKRLFDTPEYLKVSGPYRRLKFLLQQEVNNYIKRGINDPIARGNFIENVKIILDKRHIKEYDFITSENDLKGIILRGIPFFEEVIIELKTKGK
jgi:hypothetical protein